MSGNRYRGTSSEQDYRWKDKQNKLLNTIKFPTIYQTRIDMKQIKFDSIESWINHGITQIIGIEDEILVSLICNLLKDTRYPDPKLIHIQLIGFLESNTEKFMIELWSMLINSQCII